MPDLLLPVYADTMKSWHLSHAFHQHLKSRLMPFMLTHFLCTNTPKITLFILFVIDVKFLSNINTCCKSHVHHLSAITLKYTI